MFYVVEVIETKKAYRTGQKDDDGKLLFDGSILVKTSSESTIAGHIKNLWCAPALFNKRIPLIGEKVLIFEAPSTEKSSARKKNKRYFYFSTYNTVDDVSLHHFPLFFNRDKTTGPDGTKSVADILADKKELGYTINKKVKGAQKLQPFEGDDIWEGRFGQSIRFSHTYKSVNSPGIKIYQQDALKNWPGKSQYDPIAIFRVKFPKASAGYDIEDLEKDQSSLYLTTSQKLLKFKAGFNKNCFVKGIANWAGAQAMIDSDRIVINAKKDHAFLIGKKSTIITGKKVVFQSDKFIVDLDDLMTWLQKFNGQFRQVCTGESPLTTAMGPTGPSKHSIQVTKTSKVDFKLKFKKFSCNRVPGLRLGILPPIGAIISPLINAVASAGATGPVSNAISSAASNSNSSGGGGGGSAGSGGGGGGSAGGGGGGGGSAGSGGGSAGSGGGGGGGGSFGGGGPKDQYATKRPSYMKNKKCKNLSQSGKQKGFASTQNIAGGLPTRNGRKFNHPISVELGEKASSIMKNNNLVITDTNDWRGKDGKPHKSLDQQHGLSFDANFNDKKWSADKIRKVANEGKAQGLKFKFEIGNRDEVVKIVKENPDLEGTVIYVERITDPHFSVYFDC